MAATDGTYRLKGVRPAHLEYDKQKSTLTEEDLFVEDCSYPVTDADFVSQDNIENKIYVLNRCGRDMRILGTPLDVDFVGERHSDPDNYDMEVKESVNNDAFFPIECFNTVWVQWSISDPINQYVQHEPTFCVDDPNGKQVTWYLQNGRIRHSVTDNAMKDPNCLRLISRLGKSKIDVSIYTHDPCDIRPPRSLEPAQKFIVDTRSVDEYCHIIDWTLWLCDFFDTVSFGADDTNYVPKNALARTYGTEKFKVGTAKYYDVLQQVRPGDYVTIVACRNDGQTRYKMIAQDYRGLKLIPQAAYQVHN